MRSPSITSCQKLEAQTKKGSFTAYFVPKRLLKHPLVATHWNERLRKRHLAQGLMVFRSHTNRVLKISLFYSHSQHLPKEKQQLPKFCFKLYSVEVNPKVKLLTFLRWFGNFSTLEKTHDTFAASCLQHPPESTVHLLPEHPWKPGLLPRKKEQELQLMSLASWTILCNPLNVV